MKQPLLSGLVIREVVIKERESCEGGRDGRAETRWRWSWKNRRCAGDVSSNHPIKDSRQAREAAAPNFELIR